MNQTPLFKELINAIPGLGDEMAALETTPSIGELNRYDKIIVAFSGGKDSLACVLHLLDLGVERSKVELWHHDIDGKPSIDEEHLMDWPITADYCTAVATTLGLPIYFSWREGGFQREMLRKDQPTGAVITETPDGLRFGEAKQEKKGTRLKFPQVSPNLAVRWCSAYLKIDVAARAITMQERFSQGRFLMVTGERAEESVNRARYKDIEPHRTSNKKRHVTQWRPVLRWSEKSIWDIIEKHRIRPHPAYLIGLSRVSCMCCIFSSPTQWATVRFIAPKQFAKVAGYENDFDVTIRRKGTIIDAADSSLPMDVPEDLKALANSRRYTMSPILPENERWIMPKGAFGKCSGPS